MTQYLHILAYFNELETEIRKYTTSGWQLVSHTAIDEHTFSIIFKKETPEQ